MSYTKVTMIFESEEVAKAAVLLVGNTKACIHHKVEAVADETAIALTQTLQQQTMSRRWCMCTKLDGVARDCFSTCSICNGQDAYGKSQQRPLEFQKVLDRDKEKAT